MSNLQGEALNQLVLMSRQDGKELSYMDYLREAIIDVLLTPIGSRVGRRNYGSRLFRLLDSNVTRFLPVQMTNAIADAIMRNLPIVKVEEVKITALQLSEGKIICTLSAYETLLNRRLDLENLSLDFFIQNSRYQ